MAFSRWRELLPFPVRVNDVHSALNASRVARVLRPRSTEDVQQALIRAKAKGMKMSVAGGRHAMGGQQFGQDALLLDCRRLAGLKSLDRQRGLATMGAGTLWPQVYRALAAAQAGADDRWTFRQKQTGGDRLSLGGSVAANIHSRGLTMKPFVEDLESLTVVTCDGTVRKIQREDGTGLWPLVVGGYGLFGIVSEVELRLARRHKVRRRVDVREVDGLVDSIQERIRAGYEFGDFQFAIEPSSDAFLRQGSPSRSRQARPKFRDGLGTTSCTSPTRTRPRRSDSMPTSIAGRMDRSTGRICIR
jgi:FAD/FMN-containing dehydrogenase